MKPSILLTEILAFALFLAACNTKMKNTKDYTFTVSEAPYLGQKRPGLIAEKFQPGTLSSKGWQLPSKFEPGMHEFYITNTNESPYDPTVIVFRKENRVWKRHDFYKQMSGSDTILYSKTNYIERTDSGWSEMKSLGDMFAREDWGIMRLSASAKGTYVLDDWKNKDVIRISSIKDGKLEAPMLMGKNINTGKWTAHPFIAPDGSYLIWDSEREGGYGDSNLYISFRQTDGSWGRAINMGAAVNTKGQENAAMLTTDGNYLFFGRAVEKVKPDGSTHWEGSKYWIDAEIIQELKSKQ